MRTYIWIIPANRLLFMISDVEYPKNRNLNTGFQLDSLSDSSTQQSIQLFLVLPSSWFTYTVRKRLSLTILELQRISTFLEPRDKSCIRSSFGNIYCKTSVRYITKTNNLFIYLDRMPLSVQPPNRFVITLAKCYKTTWAFAPTTVIHSVVYRL